MLAIDTGYILSNLQLPPSLDMVERAYGLEWNYEKLNYRFNPYKGYAFTIGATIGNKTIKENASIVELQDPLNPEYDFSTLYDSIDLKSFSDQDYIFYQWPEMVNDLYCINNPMADLHIEVIAVLV